MGKCRIIYFLQIPFACEYDAFQSETLIKGAVSDRLHAFAQGDGLQGAGDGKGFRADGYDRIGNNDFFECGTIREGSFSQFPNVVQIDLFEPRTISEGRFFYDGYARRNIDFCESSAILECRGTDISQ